MLLLSAFVVKSYLLKFFSNSVVSLQNQKYLKGEWLLEEVNEYFFSVDYTVFFNSESFHFLFFYIIETCFIKIQCFRVRKFNGIKATTIIILFYPSLFSAFPKSVHRKVISFFITTIWVFQIYNSKSSIYYSFENKKVRNVLFLHMRFKFRN